MRFERTRAEYPGAFDAEFVLPVTDDVAESMGELLDAGEPLVYGPHPENPVPGVPDRFSVQSQIISAVRPRTGKAWMLGMHQCSHPRIWTADDRKLFEEITARVSECLSSLLILNDLRESEGRFRAITENTTDCTA